MTIGEGAPVKCATGSRECWEAFASKRAMKSRFEELDGGASQQKRVVEIIELALEGDDHAVSVIKETTRYLGIGIANIIQALGPESVILAGDITEAWSLIEDDLRSAIESCMCREYHSTRLVRSDFGPDAAVMGALSLSLAPKFAAIGAG